MTRKYEVRDYVDTDASDLLRDVRVVEGDDIESAAEASVEEGPDFLEGLDSANACEVEVRELGTESWTRVRLQAEWSMDVFAKVVR